MTKHEIILKDIEICRRRIVPLRTIALCGFILLFITQHFFNGDSAIRITLSLITFIVFILWVLAVADVAKKVQCPNCQKKLGYLLLDPSYSKTFSPIWLPRDIPDNINQCPYCHTNFEEEMAEQTDGGYQI
ncbi:MAG: hypothetical protein KAH23_04960 [Kiritimatiellae bacterium]|nr:hypothetical protein [Kiritimatiellia bacterium]